MRFMPSVFNDFFDDGFFTPATNDMRCDIKESDNGYTFNMALPGYDKDHIRMSLEDGYLKVEASADTTNEDKDAQGRVIRKERYLGSCARSFYVGDNLTEDDITAKYENGELIINVPKKEAIENKTNYIEIH